MHANLSHELIDDLDHHRLTLLGCYDWSGSLIVDQKDRPRKTVCCE